MMRALGLILLLLAIALMAGCSHNAHRAAAEAAYYEAQASALVERQPIVELVARPGEAIVLQGVERFAVYAPDGNQGIRQYQGGSNPWIDALRILGDIGLKGFGVYELSKFATAAVTHAGGNTSINNSGRMDSPGDTAGGDLIHGGRIDNSGRIGSDGDDIGGDRIDNSGRWYSPGDDRDTSPGPIDQGGDCRDGADCSTQPPNEPDPGGD